jgi:hypothetical protein
MFIPGYIDEPAARPAAPAPTSTTPTAKPPLTTPTQAKFEQPAPPPPVSLPVVVEADLFPTVVEPASEPVAAAPAELDVTDTGSSLEVETPSIPAEPEIAEAKVESIEEALAPAPAFGEEAPSEEPAPTPSLEPTEHVDSELSETSDSSVIAEESEFPTIFGERVFDPVLPIEIESVEAAPAAEVEEVEFRKKSQCQRQRLNRRLRNNRNLRRSQFRTLKTKTKRPLHSWRRRRFWRLSLRCW